MSWNYRIMKRVIDGVDVHEIHEVYYNPDGSIKAWTETSITPTGEDLEELKKDFSHQLLAFDSPVLDYDALSLQTKFKD